MWAWPCKWKDCFSDSGESWGELDTSAGAERGLEMVCSGNTCWEDVNTYWTHHILP